MQIQVNTGSQTRGSAGWSSEIKAVIEETLSRSADRITRAEVHLNDENSASKEGGNDNRCQIEVRVAGMQPISVTNHADSHDEALRGAADKMVNLLDTTFGKLESR
ncbi:MAG: HPF/RaiA family ribosome-associated protein [Phycisphaerales bacterium]|nr:HPF/RaiA family ribosome-associated protein [Phycisphaerales bacterium]